MCCNTFSVSRLSFNGQKFILLIYSNLSNYLILVLSMACFRKPPLSSRLERYSPISYFLKLCFGRLNGRGVGEEWIHVYVWLSSPPETITTLLISYTPIQNKKFVFKNDYTYMYIHTYIHIHTHNRILLSHKNE